MMACPQCSTKCAARNTEREKKYVRRNYYCGCGKSFTTREKITRVWDRINPIGPKSVSGDAARISAALKAQRTQRETVE